jgi:hypothetical protein
VQHLVREKNRTRTMGLFPAITEMNEIIEIKIGYDQRWFVLFHFFEKLYTDPETPSFVLEPVAALQNR